MYSYTYSIAAIFVTVGMLGVKNHGSRTIAAVRDDRAALSRSFWATYALQAAVCLLSLAAYLFYATSFAQNPLISAIWAMYVLSAALDVNWFFFGLERFKLTVTRNAIIKLLTVVLMFALVRSSEDLFKYVALMAASFLASQLALWPFLLREVDFARPSARDVASNAKPMLVLFVPVVAVSVYTQMDKVLLGALSTMEQAGFFENSFKVATLPLTLVTALGTVMLPRVSSLVAAGKADEGRSYLSKSMWFAMLVSFPLAFGMAAIAPVLAPVYFGPGFEPCSLVITVIVADLPFMAWANVVRTQYLIPWGKDRVYVVSVVLGAAVNLALNLFLDSSFGALGAGIATICAEMTVCVYQTLCVRRELPVGRWLRENAPYLVCAAAMFVCVRLVGGLMEAGVACLLAEIAAGVVSYSVLAGLYLVLTRNRYAKETLLPMLKKARGVVSRK